MAKNVFCTIIKGCITIINQVQKLYEGGTGILGTTFDLVRTLLGRRFVATSGFEGLGGTTAGGSPLEQSQTAPPLPSLQSRSQISDENLDIFFSAVASVGGWGRLPASWPVQKTWKKRRDWLRRSCSQISADNFASVLFVPAVTDSAKRQVIEQMKTRLFVEKMLTIVIGIVEGKWRNWGVDVGFYICPGWQED